MQYGQHSRPQLFLSRQVVIIFCTTRDSKILRALSFKTVASLHSLVVPESWEGELELSHQMVGVIVLKTSPHAL